MSNGKIINVNGLTGHDLPQEAKEWNCWMQTASGKQFYPFFPEESAIDITDIAHGLSLTCRFSGQCSEFYSVAQHSLHVALAIADNTDQAADALWGLLHDASEAYIGDMVSPLKQCFPEYRRVESRIMRSIAAKFGLPDHPPESVKYFDNVMLVTEVRDLKMSTAGFEEYFKKYTPFPGRLTPLPAAMIEATFLDVFFVLSKLCAQEKIKTR